jgi:hypothetical protein
MPCGRGFIAPDAVLSPPIHLDEEVLTFLVARAEAQGVSSNS